MHYAFHVKKTIAIVACLIATLFSSALAQEESAPPPNEETLIAVLGQDGDYMTHLAAFRGLRQVGTEACIPAVAPFLHDAKKSHLARYVLEDMSYLAAGQALRDAVNGAPPEVLTGIVATLGARRDAEAVPVLQPLLSSDNADVARFTRAALGRIASPEAVTALREARKATKDKAVRLEISQALLAAAQNLVDDGKKAAAAKIYTGLSGPKIPEFIREGAFAGLAQAAPGKTPERVIAAIQGDDPLYRNLARETVAATHGKKATEQYVAALPALPADVQLQMLAGLSRRGDKTARPGVVALVGSDNADVKKAALDALGELGNGKDVSLLASLMLDPSEDIATAARNSLIRLRGTGVDNAIAATMKKSDADVRAKLLNILSVRISDQAVPQAQTYLNDDAESVRLAALNVFLQQGQTEDFNAVLDVMKNAAGDAERDLAARTLSAIAKGGGAACLPLVLEGMKDAPEPVKVALVDALGNVGGSDALAAVKAQLDGPPALKKKALSVLSDWPTQDAAETLLALAKSEDPDSHDAGIRGYTRLAEAHPEHDPRNAMMATAMELTRSKEEKWMVLSAYGNVHTGPAMDALDAQLSDPEVQKEAAMALLKVSEAVMKHGEGGQARAKKSLELLKTSVPTEYIVKRCDELLAKIK